MNIGASLQYSSVERGWGWEGEKTYRESERRRWGGWVGGGANRRPEEQRTPASPPPTPPPPHPPPRYTQLIKAPVGGLIFLPTPPPTVILYTGPPTRTRRTKKKVPLRLFLITCSLQHLKPTVSHSPLHRLAALSPPHFYAHCCGDIVSLNGAWRRERRQINVS